MPCTVSHPNRSHAATQHLHYKSQRHQIPRFMNLRNNRNQSLDRQPGRHAQPPSRQPSPRPHFPETVVDATGLSLERLSLRPETEPSADRPPSPASKEPPVHLQRLVDAANLACGEDVSEAVKRLVEEGGEAELDAVLKDMSTFYRVAQEEEEAVSEYAQRKRKAFETYRQARRSHREAQADDGSSSSSTSDYTLMDLDDEEEFPPLRGTTTTTTTTTTKATPLSDPERDELCLAFSTRLSKEATRISLAFRRTLMGGESWEATLEAAEEVEREMEERSAASVANEDDDAPPDLSKLPRFLGVVGSSSGRGGGGDFLNQDFGALADFSARRNFDEYVFRPIDYDRVRDPKGKEAAAAATAAAAAAAAEEAKESTSVQEQSAIPPPQQPQKTQPPQPTTQRVQHRPPQFPRQQQPHSIPARGFGWAGEPLRLQPSASTAALSAAVSAAAAFRSAADAYSRQFPVFNPKISFPHLHHHHTQQHQHHQRRLQLALQQQFLYHRFQQQQNLRGHAQHQTLPQSAPNPSQQQQQLRPTCHKCGKPGHLPRECPSGLPPGVEIPNDKQCFHCLQYGHVVRNCPKNYYNMLNVA